MSHQETTISTTYVEVIGNVTDERTVNMLAVQSWDELDMNLVNDTVELWHDPDSRACLVFIIIVIVIRSVVFLLSTCKSVALYCNTMEHSVSPSVHLAVGIGPSIVKYP
ncbi:hypothetical protein A0H81_12361 [Grifola frondosa]|uniref:Uncharacterized protein n=1 Tax=Grifola frondosa TaxID=5627 RepID=A0A1C7LT39_GRIFR|nr:hypothetical protein A0H81_12361 [Grifola frondosa]